MERCMKHLILSPTALAALVAVISGCGSARHYKAAPASVAYDMPAEEAVSEGGADAAQYQLDGEAPVFEDEVVESNLVGAEKDMAGMPPPSPPTTRPRASSSERIEAEPSLSTEASQVPDTVSVKAAGKPRARLEEPMVMYSGYLKLRVKRLLESMDEITRLTEEQGGYIESMTERVIIVRIPKGDFDAAMATFRKLGELLDERIESLDVTEQFTDLAGRLTVAKEARERLLKLLKEVKDVTERLRIMQEIKRLTEQIESIESRLETLKNLVDYFTITIELVPVLETRGVQQQRSPFPWIQGLSAHSTTLFDGKDDIRMTLPKGFVLFDEAGTYRAQAADTTIIRAGVVDNEPRGDNPFWSAAVHHEMEGRSEILVDSGTAGKLAYRLYRSDDVAPRYYLVAVYAMKERLYVVEGFYPNEEAEKAHHKGVVEALKTFEVK
jgi:hypothetical protein